MRATFEHGLDRALLKVKPTIEVTAELTLESSESEWL